MHTTRAERAASGYPIYNRTDVGWAHANRSAEAVCLSRGYDGGLYTGHQSGEIMGINCSYDGSTVWMHLPGSEVRAQPFWIPSYAKLEGLEPYRANNVGHTLCQNRGYGTGFLNGHYNSAFDLYGVVCIPQGRTFETTIANQAFAGKPWWWYRIVAEDACLPHGANTGNIIYFYGSTAVVMCIL